MRDDADLNAEDWRELELAPLWILAAIGGADGKIDDSERRALIDGIDAYRRHADDLVRGVFERAGKQFDTVWERYKADGRTAPQGLRAVSDALSRAGDERNAMRFKQTLMQLAAEVADASGGFLGLGSKRSGVERKALNGVAAALGLPSRQLSAKSQLGFEAILVPLDGSRHAETAVAGARALAEPFGSKVMLLGVVPDDGTIDAIIAEGYEPPPYMVNSAKEARVSATLYVEDVRSTYGAAGWQAAVAEGQPSEVIVNEARHFGADVIVMATSWSSGVKRIFEGAVTEQVARKTDVPVFLVPVVEDEY